MDAGKKMKTEMLGKKEKRENGERKQEAKKKRGEENFSFS